MRPGRPSDCEARAEVFLVPFIKARLGPVRRTGKLKRDQGVLIRGYALLHVLRALAEPLSQVKFLTGRARSLAGSHLEPASFPRWRRKRIPQSIGTPYVR